MKQRLFVMLLLALSFSIRAEVVLMSYNVHNCIGMDGKFDVARIAGVLSDSDADVVCLQELDSVTQRSNGRDLLQELGSLTGMHATYAAAISYLGGSYGIGVLSRQEPLSVVRVPLPGREERRVLLVVEFADCVVANAHLSLVAADQLSSIRILRRALRVYDKPVYLMGDFNALPDSRCVKRMSKRFCALSSMSHYTFPASVPNRCIDYVWGVKASGRTYEVVESRTVNEAVASDHRPIVVRVR